MKVPDWYHQVPPPVKEIFTALQKSGYTSYLVGGAVRDFLLGGKPKDFDLVTDARPEQIAALFPKTVDVGRRFGIMVVVQSGLAVEVASFRKDREYKNGRHPESIEYADPETDARRRDFTVNGLFWNPLDGEIIDFVNGCADLESRVLRAIGDPRKRFREDALRMIRAARFASQLAKYNFTIDQDVLAAISEQKNDLQQVSPERITQELQHILLSAKPSLGLRTMAKTGMMAFLFPELTAAGESFYQSIDSLRSHWQQFSEDPPSSGLFWAALLLLAKTPEQKKTFLQRLIFLKEDKQLALRAHELSMELNQYPLPSKAENKMLLADNALLPALTLRAAQNLPTTEIFSQYSQWKKSGILQPAPLLAGKDLLALGIPAGPKISQLLAEIRRSQLEEQIHSKEDALKLLKTL